MGNMVDKFAIVLKELASPESVHCAVLFGSYARSLFQRGQAADYLSDIDVQFIIDAPERFESRMWMPESLLRCCNSYFVRDVPGGGRKAAIRFAEISVEVVFIGLMRMRIARMMLRVPKLRSCGVLKSRLLPLSDIMRYEHVIVKGGVEWARFYRNIASVGGRCSLSNRDAKRMVKCAIVDGRSALAKLARGERYAAIRVLRCIILETNFRLVNEIRERAGLPALHRGRRIEAYLNRVEISWVEGNPNGGCQEIADEVRKGIDDMVDLYLRLLGDNGKEDVLNDLI